MAIRNVLIVGNQKLSRTIIEALCTDPLYRLSVLTSTSQTPYLPLGIPPGSVQHWTTDFSLDSLHSVLSGQELVISTVSGGDYDFQKRLIDVVVDTGATRFIAHEFEQDSLNEAIQARSPPSAQRAKTIAYLRQKLNEKGSSLEWVAIAAGCILDLKLSSGDLGFDLRWQSATIHGTGSERFAASSLQRVAMAVKHVVERWDQVKNQFLYTAGVITTANEVLACLEKSSGAKWTVGYTDVEDCIREGSNRIERGFPDAGMFLMERSILYDENLKAVENFESNSANDLLDLKPERVRDIVDQTYSSFKQHGHVDCGCR